MSIRTRVLIASLLIVACVGADRITKSVAREHLSYQRPTEILGGIIRLEFVENHGAFLGLGGDLPSTIRFLLLVVISGGLIPVTIWLAVRSRHTRLVQVIGLALIAGGGTGNLIDRIFNDGAVADFISMGIGPLRTGIFNLADFAITTGLAVLVVAAFTKRESLPERAE